MKDVCKAPDDSGQKETHESCCRKSKIPVDRTIIIGQHQDGVPFHKSQSLEVISWNLPAIPWMERVFYGCLEKMFTCACGCGGRHTYNSLLAPFILSMTVLFEGLQPTMRHDGSEFTPYDKKCGRLSSYEDPDIGCHVLLVEIRKGIG